MNVTLSFLYPLFIHHQIYTVEWNTFLPNVFISCAAEWNVKIWDMNNSSPLYTFDVKAPAGDVAWAPYSR